MILSVILSDGPDSTPFKAAGSNILALGSPRDSRSVTLLVNAEPIGEAEATSPDGVKVRRMTYRADADAMRLPLSLDGPPARVLLREGRHNIWLKRVTPKADGTYSWHEYDFFIYDIEVGEPTDQHAAALPAFAAIMELRNEERYAEMLPKIEDFVRTRLAERSTDQSVVLMVIDTLAAKAEGLGNMGDFAGSATALDQIDDLLKHLRTQANPENAAWIDKRIRETAGFRAQLDEVAKRQRPGTGGQP
jgi:hypothetical protein